MSAEFVGKSIVEVRSMTSEELQLEGWDLPHSSVPVFVLDDGTLIYPSQDEEGNGPGQIFGSTNDSHFMVMINAPEPVSLDNG